MVDTNESKGVVVDTATALRADVLTLETAFKDAKAAMTAAEPLANEDRPEVMSNITLAFHHLEDARMRLGKVIQAASGGVSVYDKQADNSTASNSNGAGGSNSTSTDAGQTDGPKEGDACTTEDNKEGTMQGDPLVCVATPVEGDACTMPDGKTSGTLVKEHDGSLVCSVAK